MTNCKAYCNRLREGEATMTEARTATDTTPQGHDALTRMVQQKQFKALDNKSQAAIVKLFSHLQLVHDNMVSRRKYDPGKKHPKCKTDTTTPTPTKKHKSTTVTAEGKHPLSHPNQQKVHNQHSHPSQTTNLMSSTWIWNSLICSVPCRRVTHQNKPRPAASSPLQRNHPHGHAANNSPLISLYPKLLSILFPKPNFSLFYQ